MRLKPINTYIQKMPRSGIRRIMDSATAPDGFNPRIESIAACITPATKVIVHNSPSNPTGAVCPEAFIKELMALAREKNWLKGLKKSVTTSTSKQFNK